MVRGMAPWAVVVCLMQHSARADDTDWQRFMTAGAAADEIGDYKASVAAYQNAVHGLEELHIDDFRLLRAINLLAGAYEMAGRYADAESSYRRALKIAETHEGSRTADYAIVLSNLGTLLVDEGRSVRGIPLLRQSLDIYRSLHPEGDLRVALMENALARGLLTVRNYIDAETLLDDALSIYKKSPKASIELLETLVNNRAAVRQYQGRWEESRQLTAEAIESLEGRRGKFHPTLIRPLNNLAVAYAKLGQLSEAEAAFLRALALCEKFLAPADQVYTTILNSYSEFLRKEGRKSEARTLSAKAKRAMQEAARRNGIGLTVDVSTLRAR